MIDTPHACRLETSTVATNVPIVLEMSNNNPMYDQGQ